MSKISSCLIRAAFVFCIVIMAACSDNGSSNDAPPDSPDIPIDNTPPSTDFVPPAGIYLLGVRNSISELRDYPFVDGYVLRTGWGMIETAENKYDFSTVDEFIEALDAINQKLTLVIFSQRVPDYVLAKSTVEKYDTPNQNGTGDTYETVVPWDEAALDRYQIFIKALGDHRVMSLEMGVEVALRDHPVLNIIGAQIMGLGGLRDPSDVIANRDSYSREKFTAASLSSLDIVVTEFPKKFVHIALFGISDDNDNPALDDHVVSSIKTEFNSGASPKVGVFAENLACSTPGINGGDYIFTEQDSTYTMFQMLQAWQDTFKNPEKTDVCNSDTNGPDIAMKYAFDNFNTRYFEVYPADLDYIGYWDALQEWHDFFASSLE